MSAVFPSTSPIMPVAPDKFAAIRSRYTQESLDVLVQAKQSTLSAPNDRRFRDQAWSSNPVSLVHAHLYLLTAQALQELVDALHVDDAVRERIRFNVMQWTEAVSPTNFLFSNPQAQQKALETNGQSLSAGLALLLEDLQKGRLTQTDETAFDVGVNIATTPGSVVFENPLMQLIQYSPETDVVFEKPLLMVPPCINKYYILDLQEKNSFVRHAVQQGFTVFLISWRNPLPEDTDNIQQATWGDYLQHGILKAIQVCRQITGQDQINALGFCVGGTMLSSALALAHAQDEKPVSSLTLLTSFLDFEHAGILDVFVDEQHAQIRDARFGQGGLMTAGELANTFSILRPGELVWNYVTSSYLLGEPPRPFDLLFWNADGTNLPGPFFAWYFRNAYLENNLIQPGKVTVDGHAINFETLDMPVYIYGSREDHIVPWHGAYASVHILPKPDRFVLGASGHIAGVINPPDRGRRSYWAHDTMPDADLTADQWLASATEHAGSWWPDWIQWLASQSGARVPAPTSPGNKTYTPIEDAPGRYVRVRAL